MSRFGRKLLFMLATLLSVVAIALVVLHLSLPSLVRWQLNDILNRAGYSNPVFSVTSASLFGARIEDLRAGDEGQLSVASAEIGYEPRRVVFGRIEALRVRRATFKVNLDSLAGPSAGETADAATRPSQPLDLWLDANAKRLPLWSLQFEDCELVLTRGGSALGAVRAGGYFWREGLPADRTRFSLRGQLLGEPPIQPLGLARNPTTAPASAPASPASVSGGWAIDGTVNFGERWLSVTYSVDRARLDALLVLAPPMARRYVERAAGRLSAGGTVTHTADGGAPAASLTLDLAASRIDGGPALAGVRFEGVSAAFDLAGLFPPRAPEQQRVTIESIQLGEEQRLTGVQLTFDAAELDRVVLSEARASWAGGHICATRPATIDPTSLKGEFAISFEHVSLGEFVKLVSGGTASGEGRLSGELAARVAWPRVRFRAGQIKSDAPGALNFGQKVGDLAATITERDPRLRGQRAAIMEALTNFQYDSLLFDVQRDAADDSLKVVTRVSGRGRSGFKTPIDLTINYSGDLEDALNAYLGTTGRVRTSGD